MNQRENFEAWGNEYFNYGFKTDAFRDNEYEHEETQMAWEAWQAALAASGGNAAQLPELPSPALEMTDLYSADQMTSYGKTCHAVGRGAAVREYIENGTFKDVSAPNAALVAALKNLMHLADEFGIQSGVCCCGDDMKRHGNPMDCGHSPVDSGEYYTASAIEEARKALSAAGQEVGHG